MRKHIKLIAITLSITLLLMTLCGCGRKNDDDFTPIITPDQIGESTTTENSQNTEAPNEQMPSNNSTTERPQASINLSITINIWDYINNGEWDYYGMAAAIGWDNVTKDFSSRDPRVAKNYYATEDHKGATILQIWRPTDKSDRNYIDECTVHTITLSGHGEIASVAFNSQSTNGYYKVIADKVELQVPLELIITTAYLMENFEDSPKETIRQAFPSSTSNVEIGTNTTITCN